MHADLLAKLEAFDIDGDTPELTFAARLARENGWGVPFAERVVREYKRFVFLCRAAGHPCTPSEHVDQAWHLHMTYTRSYWDRMGAGVLGEPLHHNPTRGGEREDDKFDDWYARTKTSYETLIGEPPPEDIWPPHEQRFGSDLHWQRVNTARHWVVPKPRSAALGLTLATATAAGVLAGCTGTTGGKVAATIIIAGLLVTGFVLMLKFRGSGGSGGCGSGFGCGGGCGGGCGS